METTYNPSKIEQSLYQQWEQKGYFIPHGDLNKSAYCIMIPPPNVTGSLHMGHAFQDTIMDTLTRYHRMNGDNTLWQVGTDHAGIATQMVVERKIAAEENKSKTDYGREAFIDKIWQWKAESGGQITKQLRRLGASVDWTRERFTMDDGLSNAVKEVFVQLYQQDLIYRGKRLVNWDPKLHTAISDLEVENVPKKGFMWYFRYPLAHGAKTLEGKDYIVVATTRPETMLGDTGVAVNPEDPRYKHLIGQHILLPIVNRFIPIVGDDHADMEKGTGCVKITPAHDFNDYEVGKRHQLPMINIFTFDAMIRKQAQVFNYKGEESTAYSDELPESYQGIERFTARKQIVAQFEQLGLLEEIKDHELTIPYGDRGGVVIEPLLTDQWYVRADILAKPAIEAVENGSIQFVPKQYENMYFSWMRDIQDWCISRQLWWGHRIPAWYDNEGHVYVGRDEAAIRTEYKLSDELQLNQDEDVLDTWFSSALWTFSTLGWPQQTPELKTFHPTNVLVTGFDIIFFWVARMIMMTMHFVKDDKGCPQVPFKTVYVTGLIRDENGDKMSKSKGNVLDPLDMIDGIGLEDLVRKRTDNMMQPQLAEKIAKRTRQTFKDGIEAHGTDALRFTLVALASTGRDINWDMKRLEGYRNFCNKLWNASRYVLMNTESNACGFDLLTQERALHFSLADRWIQAQFKLTTIEFHKHIMNYRLDLAANTLYEFIWVQFCDWYLELTKPVIWKGEDLAQQATRYSLLTTLEQVLRLAHPMMPYITESIWQSLKLLIPGVVGETIMLQSLPQAEISEVDQVAIADQEWVKQFIVSVRNLRAEYNISPAKELDVMLLPYDDLDQQRVLDNKTELLALAKLSDIKLIIKDELLPLCATQLVGHSELKVAMAGIIDKEAELARLNKEIEKITVEIEKIEIKLANDAFVAKAPEAVVIKERARVIQLQQNLGQLNGQKIEIDLL